MCKVRRISEDRSVFVLKDIVKLPDVQIVDQPQSPTFEIQSKTASPQSFSAHNEDVKIKWLREIGQHANDPLALHEHTVDDLRIDPTQIKADTDTESFRLPPRIDAHEPESVRPSEVAKDHHLPHPDKPKSAADLAIETKPEVKVEKRLTTTTSPAVATAKSTASTIETNTQQASAVVATKQTVIETKVTEQPATEIKASQQQSIDETKSVHKETIAKTKVVQQHTISETKSVESKLEKEKLTTEEKVISHQQQSTTLQSSSESSKVAAVTTITKDSQSQKTTSQSAATVVEQKSVAKKEPAAIKVAPPVEPKIEYTVTEPQSLNASSASINTIADIGSKAQIQGKQNYI